MPARNLADSVRAWRWAARACAAGALVTLGACATMVHGGVQQVGIASAPSGARVTIDGVDAGVTPLVASLSRRRAHVVRIARDGYAPFEGRVGRNLSAWALLDYPWILLVVPVVVDVGTGALWDLHPSILSATLSRQPPSATPPSPTPPPWPLWLR